MIPAWNEEQRLPATLESFIPALSQLRDPYEIIVVTDGSTDRTKQVSLQYADRGVRVLDFPDRLGKGGAILAGLRQSTYGTVGFVDADGPVPASEVVDLARQLGDFDCVVGSRRVESAEVVRVRSPSRRFFSRGWNLIVRAVLGLPLQDTQCGVKFFRRAAVVPVLPDVQVKGWAFDVDLLFRLRKAGRSFKEVAVTWEEQKGTKLALPVAIPVMFLSLLRIRLAKVRASPSRDTSPDGSARIGGDPRLET